MHRVGIEAPGVGGVRQVVDAIEQIGRLAGEHDDRPLGAEAHDLIGREQRPTLDVFADTGGDGAGPEAAPALVGVAGGLETDGVLAMKLCQRG